jgi:hypothetical protein
MWATTLLARLSLVRAGFEKPRYPAYKFASTQNKFGTKILLKNKFGTKNHNLERKANCSRQPTDSRRMQNNRNKNCADANENWSIGKIL